MMGQATRCIDCGGIAGRVRVIKERARECVCCVCEREREGEKV